MYNFDNNVSFDIFIVGNLQNILMIFVIKEKFIIFSHIMYCCLLLQI